MARGAHGAPRKRPLGRPVPSGREHAVRLHARGVAGRLPDLGRGSPEAPGSRHGRHGRAPRGRRTPAGRPRPRRGSRPPAARGAARRLRGDERRRPPGAPPPQRGGRGRPRHLSGPVRGDAVRPGARGGRGPAPGPVRRMVRAVPAIPEPGAGPARHVPRLHRAAAGHRGHGLRRGLPARRSIRSAGASGKGRNNALEAGSRRPGLPVGHRQRARGAQGDRSRARHARRTSGRSSAPPGTTGSRSRSTTRSSARRTTPG